MGSAKVTGRAAFERAVVRDGYQQTGTGSVGTDTSVATAVQVSTDSALVSMLTTNVYRATSWLEQAAGVVRALTSAGDLAARVRHVKRIHEAAK